MPTLRPSRFNHAATLDGGGLAVWNSLHGTRIVVDARDRARAEKLLAEGGEGEGDALARRLARARLLGAGNEEAEHRRALAGAARGARPCELFLVSYGRGTTPRGERGRVTTMTPSVRRGIQAFVALRVPVASALLVEWVGPDPLAGRTAIEELNPWLAAHAARVRVPFRARVATHGAWLTEESAAALLGMGVTALLLVMNAPMAGRPRPFARADLVTTLANLGTLLERRDSFELTLRVRYRSEDAELVASLLDILAARIAGDTRVEVQLVLPSEVGGDDTLCGVGPADPSREPLLRLAAERGLRLVSELPGAEAGGVSCHASRTGQYVFGPDGAYMKCTAVLDERPENVLGRLGEDGELHVDEALLARWTEPGFIQDATCRACSLLPPCSGSACPLARVVGDGRRCPTLREGVPSALRLDHAAGRLRGLPPT